MIKYALAVLLFATPAFGVVIDDFSVGPIEVAVDWDNRWAYEVQTGLDPNVVIGGTRIIILGFDSPSQTEQAVATVDTVSQTCSLDANVSLGGYSIRWGAIDGTYADLALDADLLSDGSDSFHIDVMANAVSQTLKLTVKSGVDEGPFLGGSVFLPLPASDTPFSIRVPFSDLSNVDFHDVDYIGFSRSTIQQGEDFTLDAIRTVPEPTTQVILILGLIIVRMRR